MSTYTPAWLTRRGIRLTPTGETVLIAGAALLALAWIAVMVVTGAVVADAFGGDPL